VSIGNDSDEATADKPRPTPDSLARSVLEDLLRAELAVVVAVKRYTARGLFCTLASITNFLANGWLYLLVAAVLAFVATPAALLALLNIALAITAAHIVYPWLKRRVARLRPFEVMPQLRSTTLTMDRYSFPSGHCMTSTAAGVPIAQNFPDLLWPVVVACSVIAWARMACAHHYPTDLVVGAALGAAMAFGSMELVLALQWI
jgi:undecaprenyl-diphosphatase